MNELQRIKKRIYDDDRIEDILNKLGCHDVHMESGIYAAALPNGDNRRSVQVRINESLKSNIRSKGISGDIYALVSYIKYNCSTPQEIQGNLPQAKMWIVNEFGYHDILTKDRRERRQYNSWLKDIKKKRIKRIDVGHITPNEPISEDIKNSFLMLPYRGWIEEGISWETQIEWEIGYDWDSDRIITLVRNSIGELIGVKGRAMDDNDERKYMYIYKMNKSIELFGLHKTLPHILEKKQLLLFEGYKSVFKSWQMGYKNCASVEGDNISDAQVALIKTFGMDVEIVLCFDKDKSKKDVETQLRKITGRKLYYVIDNDDLLDKKDSPVDKNVSVFETLLEKKVRYIP